MFDTYSSSPYLIIDTTRAYNNGGTLPGMVMFDPNSHNYSTTSGNFSVVSPSGVKSNIGGTTTFSLSDTASKAIDWAAAKMQQEERLSELLVLHPEFKELHDQYTLMLALLSKA